jgi:DNA-binding HxlR family transcriptional regulator
MEASNCPRLFPLRILSRKWSYLVLRALQEPLSFAELQKELKYITNHILARELRLLQEEKLIINQERYQITAAGKALFEAIEPLVRWSVEYAGAPVCPSQKKCSACMSYPAAIGVRQFVQIGRR